MYKTAVLSLLSSVAIVSFADTAFAQAATETDTAAVENFCDLVPKDIGDKCFSILDTFKKDHSDISTTLDSIEPAEGDVVIKSPVFKNAVAIRSTRKGVMAFKVDNVGPAEAWTAGFFSASAAAMPAVAKPVANAPKSPDMAANALAATPAPSKENAAPVATVATSDTTPQITVETENPAPVAMTSGWITTVYNGKTPIVDYFTDSDSWNSADIIRASTMSNISDEGFYVRKAKLVVNEETDIHVDIGINPPKDNTGLNKYIKDNQFVLYSRNDPTLFKDSSCSVNVDIDGDTLLDKNGVFDLSVATEPMNFATTPLRLAAGVYDITVGVGCSHAIRDTAFRVQNAIVNKLSEDNVAFGYSVKVVDSNNNSQNVAVLDEDKSKVLTGANAPVVVKEPKAKLPEGYDTGWDIISYEMSLNSNVWEEPNNYKSLIWPSNSGTKSGNAKSDGIKFSEFNTIGFGDKPNQNKHGYVELAGLFTPTVSGKYTFAVNSESNTPSACTNNKDNSDAASSNSPTGNNVIVLAKIDNQVKNARLDDYIVCNDKAHNATIISTPAYYEFNLEKGKTYNLSFLLVALNTVNYKYMDQIVDGMDGRFKIYVKTPNDMAIRPLRSYEILHKV